MIKICPKCKEIFECRVDDITKCHCVNVVIDSKTLELLQEKYNDCLCNSCLKTLTI
jgi:hypothetical protein